MNEFEGQKNKLMAFYLCSKHIRTPNISLVFVLFCRQAAKGRGFMVTGMLCKVYDVVKLATEVPCMKDLWIGPVRESSDRRRLLSSGSS
jgi:hypothetical protein